MGNGHLGYRPELDGLRAVAVVSVVLCHLGMAPFSGGYVGVDVFFVLSGYFWGCKMLDSEPNFASSAKSTGRLLILAFERSVLYLLLMNVQDHQIEGWRDYARLIRSNLLAVVSQRFHIRTS